MPPLDAGTEALVSFSTVTPVIGSTYVCPAARLRPYVKTAGCWLVARGSSVGSASAPGGGGVVTVRAEVSALPSLVAMIEADPALTPAASPVALTVATAGAVEAQVITRPVKTPPAESRVVALNCWVALTTMLAVAGVTVTDATGTTITVTTDVSLLPSLVAMIEADPAVTPVARPLAFTVATAGAVETQVITRPVKTPPAESRVVALNCWGPPTAK